MTGPQQPLARTPGERAPPRQDAADARARAGLLFGLAAYGLWGVMPIYFKLLKAVPSIDIVAHRIVWSLVVLAMLATLARAWDQIAPPSATGGRWPCCF